MSVTNPQYVTKPVSASSYRVDGRATVNVPLVPTSVNVAGGPNVNVASGVRSNADRWPSASGTL